MIEVKEAQTLFINLATGKAVSDYQYGAVNKDGYPMGSPERKAYRAKIEELENGK